MGILDEVSRATGALLEGVHGARAQGTAAALMEREAQRAAGREPPSAFRSAASVVLGGPVVDLALAEMGAAAEGIAWLTAREQELSAAITLTGPMAMAAPPALPLLDVLSGGLALAPPHAHLHPPNLILPNPVPIPMPSIGALLPVPFLSGASTVLIGGKSAARCGDMGVAVFCGGFFPFFEVMTGSSSVWIEGMRAARMGELTSHCVLSAPRPTDPPIGPMMGVILGGSANVLVGGLPMPSLTSLLIAGGARLAFSAGGMLFRRLTASGFIERLLQTEVIVVNCSDAYRAAVQADLRAMARTSAGRDVLGRLERAHVRSGNAVTIEGLAARELLATPDGRRFLRTGDHNAFAQPDDLADGVFDTAGARGSGTSVTVGHSPERWGPNGTPSVLSEWDGTQWVEHSRSGPPARSTSDMVLHHELTHAANFMDGEGRNYLRPAGSPTIAPPYAPYDTGDPAFANRWLNAEEYVTVWSENGYRRESGGVLAAQRTEYGALP